MDSRREVIISNSRRGKMDENKTPQGQSQSHAPSFMPDMTDTPPRADVDEILRRKRKAREYKVRSHARSLVMGQMQGG